MSGSSTPGGLDPSEVEAVVQGSRAFGALIAESLAQIAPTVTMPQWRILVLASIAPQNVTGVAADLGVHPSNVTRACDRLVRAGLLNREQLAQDRRQVELTLSARGEKLMTRVFEHRRHAVGRVMAGMSARKRTSLAESMEAFVEVAERLGHKGRMD